MPGNGCLLDRPVAGSVAWSPFSASSRPVSAYYLRFAALETTPLWSREQTRRFLARCRGIGPDVADTAELLVSELATHAYQVSESTWTIGLSLRRFPQSLLIEVIDASPEPPVLAKPDPLSPSGRGLQLVDELSSAWGYFYPARVSQGRLLHPVTTRGEPLKPYDCSCGFANDNAEEFRDHLLMVFSPDNDLGNDGHMHAEIAKTEKGPGGGYDCSCGFVADDIVGFDDHMLLVFATADGVGIDGRRHVVADSPKAPASYVA
jgi:hypothetical protein